MSESRVLSESYIRVSYPIRVSWPLTGAPCCDAAGGGERPGSPAALCVAYQEPINARVLDGSAAQKAAGAFRVAHCHHALYKKLARRDAGALTHDNLWRTAARHTSALARRDAGAVQGGRLLRQRASAPLLQPTSDASATRAPQPRALSLSVRPSLFLSSSLAPAGHRAMHTPARGGSPKKPSKATHASKTATSTQPLASREALGPAEEPRPWLGSRGTGF